MHSASQNRDKCIMAINGDDEVMQNLPADRTTQPVAMISGTSQVDSLGENSREHQTSYCSTVPSHSLRSNYFAPTWQFHPPKSVSSPARNTSSAMPAFHNRHNKARETSGISVMPTSTSSRSHRSPLPRPSMIYDITADDDLVDDEESSARIAQLNKVGARKPSATSSRSEAVTRRKSSVIQSRNLPITAPFASLEDFDCNGVRLFSRVYVELKSGDFMKIVNIVKDTRTSEVTLRGFVFRRTREMNGVLDRKLNEVCWIIHIDDDDERNPTIQGLETVSVNEVVKRRKIRLTNLSFPALSFREDGKREESEATVEHERVLVCRYKYLCFYPNAKARDLNVWCEKGFHRLRADECDKRADNNTRDEDLRTIWRGDSTLGGAQEGWMPGEKEFLRQEAVSNKGIISRQSLKVPGGTHFLPGDPMKRGGVGTLLSKMTQSAAIPANTTSNLVTIVDDSPNVSLVIASDADDEVEMVASSSSPSTRSPQHRRHRRKPRIPLAAFGECLDPSDYDSDEGPRMMTALNTRLRTGSTSARRPRHMSPRIVEFGAQVKTSSRSGTYEKHYEGKITETYIPKLGAMNKKRKAEHFLDSSVKPRKKADVGVRDDPKHRIMTSASEDTVAGHLPRSTLYRLHEASSSDSDRTLGRSQSENSVEEICPPTRARGYESARSRSLNPLALRKSVHSSRTHGSPAKLSSRVTKCPQVQLKSTTLLQAPVKKECQKPSKENHQRYTFGDCFCGAGGMSRGAINAGLSIKWGFDFSLSACQTYALNFVAVSVYNVWANDFSEGPGCYKVDICHLSPPCQYFSDAHTWEGKDDEMNTASLFAIFNLLKKAKPRVVTLEQTSGLIRRHSIFFNAMINMFTSRGFSVRWRVLNCADFGLPQRRMRLFVIASCPGEALPPFPKPTHSADAANTGLKPYTTINEAINKIPTAWANHDIHLARERNACPQSGDKIATCITTNGGNIIHPSGKRDYTHREFACLQSFPLAHKFGGSGVKKQIGNAVPPAMATVLLEEVKKSLLKGDGLL